jgi:hypothetical protein
VVRIQQVAVRVFAQRVRGVRGHAERAIRPYGEGHATEDRSPRIPGRDPYTAKGRCLKSARRMRRAAPSVPYYKWLDELLPLPKLRRV